MLLFIVLAYLLCHLQQSTISLFRFYCKMIPSYETKKRGLIYGTKL